MAGFFVLCAVGITTFAGRCSAPRQEFVPLPAAPVDAKVSAGIKDYARPQEDTYFTYPEWYIVWSYQEKADFQQHSLPSNFPFFGEIAQYWCAYCSVNRIVTGRYPFNLGDHLMLMVIGSSFTVEYALKGIYEETVGRLSEWTSGGKPVDEDAYAASVAEQYAEFVHVRPFYEFSFLKSLRGLWTTTTWWGPHALRKWERKAFLSLDYGVEAVYCGLLTFATHAVYGIESADTYARIENSSSSVLLENARVRSIKEIGPGSEIVIIPRYQEFTDTADRLVKAGVRFLDVAGNAEILLTAIAPTDATDSVPNSQLLFSTEILTRPKSRRMALRCPVSSLDAVMGSIALHGWKIEHLYDY
ncbi:MAG TPA: hypothetical protein VH325_10200 [Bryobacteraceae bacterium]|nr:hypothetical protein [Bryobacteraceae bacterium]